MLLCEVRTACVVQHHAHHHDHAQNQLGIKTPQKSATMVNNEVDDAGTYLWVSLACNCAAPACAGKDQGVCSQYSSPCLLCVENDGEGRSALQPLPLLLLLLLLMACVPLACRGRGAGPAAGEGCSPCSSTASRQEQHHTCQLLGMIMSHFNKVPHIHSGVPSGVATVYCTVFVYTNIYACNTPGVSVLLAGPKQHE
jgi:hypothetical protein